MGNEFLGSPIFWLLILALAFAIGAWKDNQQDDNNRWS